MTSTRLALVIVGAVGVTGPGCGLSSDFSFWNAEIQGGEGGAEVTFCPVTGPDGTPAAGFVPAADAQVALQIEDEDLHTFAQLQSPSGVPLAMSELFGPQMRFDLGPVGLAYDDDGQVGLTVGGVPVTRQLVGGKRNGDDDVELQYEYIPSCDEVPLGNAGAGGSCTCAPRTLTWRFTGQQ